MRVLLLFILTLLSSIALSQPYAGQKLAANNGIQKSAGCTPPNTTNLMNLNNVSAMIHTAGNLWQVPGQNFSQYEVPKNSGIMALFTSALWLGGTDVNNQLKLAALRYRDGQDYWTGPLSIGDANTNADICEKYDRHFITTQDEIREFSAWFEAGEADAAQGTSTQSTLFPDYEVPLSVKEWPAHGDPSLGQDYYLAPFFDRNNDGEYRWEDGDYPWHDIKKTKDCQTDRRVSLYGDINYWWVMNDKGNIHTETNSEPIGMEIRAQAFAFASNDEINNMTFYNYELINRGTQTLFDTYFGYFTDGALGDPFDDYVGCDVSRGLAYYYNGDNFDGDNGGFFGYGSSPPAVGVDFFEGPFQDDDGIDNAFGIGANEALNGIGYGDSIIDNERFGMRRFLYYSNTGQGNSSQTDPIAATDYYNYLRGYWKDGSPFYYGGSGHLSDPSTNTSIQCDFMFPGDTDPLGWGTGGVPQPLWTEQTAGNPPYDRRFVQSAGPFILKPGAVNNITVGVVWARSASGGDPFASVEVLRRADDKAQALFENCFKVLDAPHAPEMNVQELENELILTLSNPVNSNNFNEEYVEFDPFIVTDVPNADKNYRFQGYQIFQLKRGDVAISDLEDQSVARLVAQCDIEDNVSTIINFEFDEGLQASYPVERVAGENKGIRHSFRVTEDQFAIGNRTLVNFKTYYYVAIAYAYNNYKDYNPNDPTAIDGQKKKYISSRKAAVGEVQILSATPHNPKPEAGGTGQNIAYGSGPIITREDGHGNGGEVIELTKESHDAILTNGFLERPSYAYGQGPIKVKVIDPLGVTGGSYTCKFRDYNATLLNGADTASWIIYRYETGSSVPIDSVTSERTISRDNEQLIPKWGISVQIKQPEYPFPQGASGQPHLRTTEFLEASLTFGDSSKRWLSGVPDNDQFNPLNWIRSGTYNPNDPCEPDPIWIDPCMYGDIVNADNEKKWDRILGGTIAPNRLVSYEYDIMPMAYVSGGATFKQIASITSLPSIDIVITSDKSKWTRCPVMELGGDQSLNVGNAKRGELRKSPSVDKNGNPVGPGVGMGWFPGYAIDLESGRRLYMMFGENSFLGGENGADLIWNPTDRLYNGVGEPILGGMQPFYVMNYNSKSINGYPLATDFPAYIPAIGENDATNEAYLKFQAAITGGTAQKRDFYSNFGWTAFPLASPGYSIDPRKLPTEATIKVRLSKQYKNFVATGKNNGMPMYSWNMDDIRTQTGSKDELADALSLINIVPNPYNAYSEYERNRLDTRVKITNLPEVCTVRIYTTSGKLVKTFKKTNDVTFIDWLLVNDENIPVASGVYLVHVEVPGVGERILKAFIAMRQVDLQGL